jgi:integrase
LRRASLVVKRQWMLAVALFRSAEFTESQCPFSFGNHAASLVWSEHELVFGDALGDPLNSTNETKRFQRAVVAAQLPAIRFHDMRHTAASILLSRGVHVKLVSEMLGHSTIVLTLDTYSHVIPTMHGDAAAAMDAVFTA